MIRNSIQILEFQATIQDTSAAHTVHASVRFFSLNFRTLKFNFLFSNTMLVFRARIHKILARIANSEGPGRPASSEAVRSGSALFV